MNVESWDKVVAMVAEAVSRARPGEWIYGRGWHQEKWTSRPTVHVEGFPTHASLDKVSPNNPVLLVHASGHAAFANGKAMELSGIRRPTESPAGGEILRDTNSDATGLLRETAQRADQARRRRAAADAGRDAARATARRSSSRHEEVLAKGITTFQDAGSDFATIDRMKQMVDEGKMGVRLWVMVRQGNEAIAPKLAQYRMIGYGNGHLTVRAIKKSIDGALGPRGAWLLAPYSDKPESTGLETTKVAEIEETARLAMQHGYQLAVHAIGDRANRETLDIFERAFKANPAKKDLRWRVEHAQHISAAGHSALRQAGRDRLDGRDPLHVGRPLRPRAPRPRRAPGRGLRVAEADEVRRRHRQRHRRAGRGRRSDRELLRERQPQAERRQGVLPGPADVADGSAEVLHASTAPTRRSRKTTAAR